MAAEDIRARIDAFVAEVSELVRQAALEAVHAALNGKGTPRGLGADLPARTRARAAEPAAPAKGRGAPAASASKPSARRGRPPKAAEPTGATSGKAGQKRDPKVLEALVERLHAHIKEHPAQRIEQIATALKLPTRALALPVKKLLRSRRITSKGEKRATTYSPMPGNGLVLLKRAKKPADASSSASAST